MEPRNQTIYQSTVTMHDSGAGSRMNNNNDGSPRGGDDGSSRSVNEDSHESRGSKTSFSPSAQETKDNKYPEKGARMALQDTLPKPG
jgi:hypothetical protein